MAYTVRRRTVEDVKKMMVPAEASAVAVSRVVNTMRGRKAGQEAVDDDDDDDLLISNTVISLKDPLSGTRIQIAARSADTWTHVTLLSHHCYIVLIRCFHTVVTLLSCTCCTALM